MQPALQNLSLQLSSSAQPCGAAAGSACASPSTLPRTGRQLTLTLDPPKPDLRISSPVPALRRCFRIGLRLLIRPASNRSLTFVSSWFIRPEPATSRRPLLLSCRPASGLSSNLSACALSLALRFHLRQGLTTLPSGFAFLLGFRSGSRPSPPPNSPAAFSPAFTARLAPRVSCLASSQHLAGLRLRPGLRPFARCRPSGSCLRTGYQPTACAACLLPALPDRLAPILRQPAFPLASVRPACASRSVPTLQP